MFTLCWAYKDKEGWDRFITKEEMKKRIDFLMREGCSNEDMMVFGPNIDYIVPEVNGEI